MSAPKDPQMILNTKRSNLPHIFVTDIPRPQISVRFALRATVFKLHPHFEASASNVSNEPTMILNITKSKVPHVLVSSVTRVQNFSPFHSTTNRVGVEGH